MRRQFVKFIPLAIGSASAVKGFDDVSREETTILGAWNTVHTLPFPPGSFRELLSFSEGGVMHETNSFLHTTSNLDLSMYGLPNSITASDGVGTWVQNHGRTAQVTFGKLLFDSSHANFGDLLVNGMVRASQNQLEADWHIQVVDPSNAVLADLGPATSQGSRIR